MNWLTIASRPEMISKSRLFLELSIYSDKVSKNGDTTWSSWSPLSFLELVFTTPNPSWPYDLSVHSLGCNTIFPFSAILALIFGTGTWTGIAAPASLLKTSGFLSTSWQLIARAATLAILERQEQGWSTDSWNPVLFDVALVVVAYVDTSGLLFVKSSDDVVSLWFGDVVFKW